MGRSFVLGAIVALVALIPPYFTKLYFDNVYPARDAALLETLVIGTLAFSTTSAILGAIRGYYGQVIASKMGSAVGLMYFNHLQHLPTRFFDERRVGEVMSRLNDMRTSLTSVSRVFQTLLMNSIYLVLVPPFLMALNWKLSILALVSTPLVAAITAGTSRITRRYMKRTAEASAEQTAIQVEAFSQIRTVKTMGLEHQVFREAAGRAEEALQLQLTSAAIGGGIGIANALVRALGAALFTWYAWTLILRGQVTLGSFTAFTAYLGFLVGPASQLAGLFADFQQVSVSLGRAFEYLDMQPEQEPDKAYQPRGAIVQRLHGAIQVSNVTFGYSPGHPVLRDVSISFEPRTISALVGPSGTGKSTLLRLLCKMDNPQSGRISIDGRDVLQFPLADLRRQIGVVWQEPVLLRGTVWDNLTIGVEKPDVDVVHDAVRACRLDSVIESLPDRYETLVAEWGATLSGGQRQRFALARALIRQAPLLLLDEATSQIDLRTEEEILRELFVRVREKTVIMVTHRVATAALADRIHFLNDGRVTASGTHEQLLQTCDEYRQMFHGAHVVDESRPMRKLGVT